MNRAPKRWKPVNGPDHLASPLPQELRSFDGYSDPRCLPEGLHTAKCLCRRDWYYPNGLRAYMEALYCHLGDDERVTPTMNAAGLSAADWFRAMLTRKPRES